MPDYVVGIDLGTTNTCASIYLDGAIKLLENAEGDPITPSFVFFNDVEKKEVTVGSYAKRIADTKPAFGVYEFKRLIGRNFDDFAVRNSLQYYPFTVEANEEKKCCFRIEKNGKIFQQSFEEITAILLRKVKDDISANMKSPVDKAVITVPAYFNHHQREATLEAAEIAGFTVLKLLNEPTAAALNYFQERKTSDTEAYYLVYDLGGGTFDVAILKKKGNQIEIVAVDGDSHLGGHDFDVLIIDYICDYLLKQYNLDVKKKRREMRRIHTCSEEAKKSLSFQTETQIILLSLVPGHKVTITLTRELFESMALHLFEKSIEILDLCLKSANIEKKQIKDVILSGGSTRIPKIQEMISKYFDGITLNKFVNPDLCVANGASVQAALFSTNSEQRIDRMEIKEVTPLSLGAADSVNRMTLVIKRNTPIPAFGNHTFATSENQQSDVLFQIYEGERTDARKNRLLGTFAMENLTPAPPGECEITLTLKIDQNGILTATAEEKYRDNVKEVQINYTRGQKAAGDQELKNSWQDAQKNKNEDEAFLKFANKKNYLLTYCDMCKYNLEVSTAVKNVSEGSQYYNICENTLDSAEHLEVSDESQLDELIETVELKLGPLVKSCKFQRMPLKDFDSRKVHKTTSK